jgi:hypothetical protein
MTIHIYQDPGAKYSHWTSACPVNQRVEETNDRFRPSGQGTQLLFCIR